ncbi:hypothetical protein [uncultured Lamprocystis sp.]|jgi:hypothetical protein|uniref:ParA family protein n=1 Tax=uncultured Lamprocystis sp. TaxID=543132 RepID=UPI0025E398FA|nr:hypothetical protein [uncultured Lamprocystis sp.]
MVITFYSYKGGVGRTQLLANTAVALANRGRDIVMVDMDLESPGLHTYFTTSDRSGPDEHLRDDDLTDCPGLIDVLTDQLEDGGSAPEIRGLLIPVDHRARQPEGGRLRLLPPGRLDEHYPRRVANFPWEAFYAERRGYAFMEYVRQALIAGTEADPSPDFVFIDSRTGLTDIGSICTAQLPDVLVVMFALHAQGIDGARRISRAVTAYRATTSEVPRLHKIFLLPSRVDENGSIDKRDLMLGYAVDQLGELGELLIELNDRLPYDPRIAYGEQIVVGSTTARPTYLSQAYERFANRLVALTGPVASRDQAPAGFIAAPVAAPRELFAAVDSLDAEVRQLSESWAVLQEGTIASLLPQAHGVADILRGARAAYTEICGIIARLTPEGDSRPAIDFCERLTDVEITLDGVRRQAKECAEIWIRRWMEQAKQRLTAVGVAKPGVVEGYLSELGDAARSESYDDLEARLTNIESLLRRDWLDQQLRERGLSQDVLGRAIPDRAGRRQWLEDRLARLLEEGDLTDASLMNQIWNALRLLASLLDERPDGRPDPTHWSAYDLLCMLASTEQSRDKRQIDLDCFVEIGCDLWVRDWHALLCADDTLGPEWPCGLDARAQLRRVAEARRPEFDALVDSVARDFMARQQSHSALLRLLDQRRDDPVVARVVERLAADLTPAANRDLLAKWLAIRAPERPEGLVKAFLLGLAEEGYEVEAFVAACAFRQRHSDRAGQEWIPHLAARYIALLGETARGADIALLLAQPSFIDVLCRIRPGLAVPVLLAGFELGPVINVDTRRTVIANLLHSQRPQDLPQSVTDWLQLVERSEAHSETVAVRLAEIHERAASLMDMTPYRGWDPSVHFSRKFREYWESLCARLLDEPGGPGERARLAEVPNAEDWIRETADQLKREGRRLSKPQGAAATNLIEGYRNMAVAISELAAAGPAGVSIRSVLEQQMQRQAALGDLAAWLASDPQDRGDGLGRRVLQAFGLSDP